MKATINELLAVLIIPAQLSLESYTGLFSSINIDFIEAQPTNAFGSIDVTFWDNCKVVMLLQP